MNGERATYLKGDIIYYTCTPKDANGQPTSNHGRIQFWTFFSRSGLVVVSGAGDPGPGVDVLVTDDGTFNPDARTRFDCHPGDLRAFCSVDDILSNTKTIQVCS